MLELRQKHVDEVMEKSAHPIATKARQQRLYNNAKHNGIPHNPSIPETLAENRARVFHLKRNLDVIVGEKEPIVVEGYQGKLIVEDSDSGIVFNGSVDGGMKISGTLTLSQGSEIYPTGIRDGITWKGDCRVSDSIVVARGEVTNLTCESSVVTVDTGTFLRGVTLKNCVIAVTDASCGSGITKEGTHGSYDIEGATIITNKDVRFIGEADDGFVRVVRNETTGETVTLWMQDNYGIEGLKPFDAHVGVCADGRLPALERYHRALENPEYYRSAPIHDAADIIPEWAREQVAQEYESLKTTYLEKSLDERFALAHYDLGSFYERRDDSFDERFHGRKGGSRSRTGRHLLGVGPLGTREKPTQSEMEAARQAEMYSEVYSVGKFLAPSMLHGMGFGR